MNKKSILLTTILSITFLSLISQPTEAAKFYFSPASSNLGSNCSVHTIDLMIDTEGADTNAADVEVSYNSAQINIEDQDPGTPGTQINTGGNSYQLFIGNSVIPNRILLTGYMDTGIFNGIGTFGRITFTVDENVSTANFNIKFDGIGNSLDSNISNAISNADLLTSVGNASYTMNVDCGTPVTPPPPPLIPPVNPPPVGGVDSTKPEVNLLTPSPGNSNVNVNSNIRVKVTDLGKGVDLNSIVITIAGKDYKLGSPELSYEGTVGGYIFIIDPADPFKNNEIVTINIAAKDTNGNEVTQSFSFRTSKQEVIDSLPPSIELISPSPEKLGVATDSVYTIKISDPGAGIDLDTFVITYLGKDYTILSPEVTFAGNAQEYIITFKPNVGISFDPFTLKVKIQDFNDNEVTMIYAYNFNDNGVLGYLLSLLSRPTTGTPILLSLLLISALLWLGFQFSLSTTSLRLVRQPLRILAALVFILGFILAILAYVISQDPKTLWNIGTYGLTLGATIIAVRRNLWRFKIRSNS